MALLFFLAPAGDEADLWKLVDDARAPLEKVRAAFGNDPARLLEHLKRGRSIQNGAPGETKERLKDGFGRETDLWIVVPKSYDPSKPAGLLIVLHGLGGNGGQAAKYFADLAEEQNYIIASPSAQKEPDAAKNEDAADLGASLFPHWWCYREGDFPLSALAALKRRFAIDENRVALGGASMGGFGAWNIGLRSPDRFSALIPVAGGVSRMEFAGGQDARMRKVLLNAFNVPVYFIHGDSDETVPVVMDRASRDQLKGFGYEHVYVEVPKGRHDLKPQWPELSSGVQKWLAGRVRQPHPKVVKHHAIGRYCPQSYWMRIAEFSGESAEVKATLKDQTIDFTATGAKKLTFYIDEKLLDLSKPIRVTCQGRKLFDGKAKPSLDVVLESWRAREDRELLYRAGITVAVP